VTDRAASGRAGRSRWWDDLLPALCEQLAFPALGK
jgi:hypothetical protein